MLGEERASPVLRFEGTLARTLTPGAGTTLGREKERKHKLLSQMDHVGIWNVPFLKCLILLFNFEFCFPIYTMGTMPASQG